MTRAVCAVIFVAALLVGIDASSPLWLTAACALIMLAAGWAATTDLQEDRHGH